ncbi:MAG: amidase [Deltaproteobacteria bacterium]|nr:amidase [Deltaproteobacteria bacterium]
MLLREKCLRAAQDPHKALARLALQLHKLSSENSFYRSFVQVFDQALSKNEPSPQGSLWGASFAAKDNMMIRGYPTSFGIKPEVIAQAELTARSISDLQQCGATLFGSSNLDELCLTHDGSNSFFGRVVNPLDAGLRVLGSSCGAAAAVAHGQVDFALGTDFGGSIRMPAASCGLCGFKPSPAFLPESGILLLSETLDTCGLLTKYSDDAVFILESLGKRVQQAVDIGSTTFLIPKAKHSTMLDEAMAACFEQILTRLRGQCSVREWDLDISFEEILETRKILAIEHCARKIEELGISPSTLPAAGKAVILFFKELSIARRAAALCRAQEISSLLAAAIPSRSILLTPTLPVPVPAISNQMSSSSDPVPLNLFLAVANLCGLPSLALPTDLKVGSLPFSVQLVGPSKTDMQLLALGSEFERKVCAAPE